MMKSKAAIFALTTAFAAPVWADDAELIGFVDANILAIFYHELGHAVIDIMDVPIFGQEEDAADVMAVLLIDWLFVEEAAQSIAYDSAFGYLNDPEGREEITYWDLHGPDEQRYFNHVCLFYGAAPDDRDDLAEELGLPDARAETCPEEYEQASESWGTIFDAMEEVGFGVPMTFKPGDGADAQRINQVLEAEVESLNAEFALAQTVTVKVESCGEANAFYDPAELSITFCTEFVDHLEKLHAQF